MRPSWPPPTMPTPGHPVAHSAGSGCSSTAAVCSSRNRSRRSRTPVVVERDDRRREQRGVHGARASDREGPDRHPGRHLHDREQRVHALAALATRPARRAPAGGSSRPSCPEGARPRRRRPRSPAGHGRRPSMRTRTAGRACDARSRRGSRPAPRAASSVSAAWRIVSQSDRDPMITPTSGSAIVPQSRARRICRTRSDAYRDARAREKIPAACLSVHAHRPRTTRSPPDATDPVPLTIAVTVFAALASRPGRRSRRTGSCPARAQPVEKACPFEVLATDRSVQRAKSTFERRPHHARQAHDLGKQVTVFESATWTRRSRSRRSAAPRSPATATARTRSCRRARGSGSTTEASPARRAAAVHGHGRGRWATTTRSRSRSSRSRERSAASRRRSARCS